MASNRVAQIASHLNYPQGMLAGQVAIITGSGQGIGAETARLFANEGAKVVVSDVDKGKSDAVAAAINQRCGAGSAVSVPGDMLDDAFIPELVKRAAEFGRGKIHIIVNNAGFTWDGVIHKPKKRDENEYTDAARLNQTTDKQWSTILALHATAPFKLVRAAAPYFRVRDGEPRNIVNISSTSGLHGNAGQANYALAKAGITGLTKTIAKEWGPAFSVRANTIAYGHISTRLTAPKESGAFATLPSGEKVALGIPGQQLAARSGSASDANANANANAKKTDPADKEREKADGQQHQQQHKDIPLGRPGTATEAAGAILAVVSPLCAYVSGQTISVTGGRNI
ncbi:MAG: hypothetical protein M1819_004816 [Sarea resinae]|nr:MAG: hypothetical protein M1819_004816 [Sarea resinae]